MNYQTELTGIVLFASPVGDYDKRLVILTKEKGKITVFVKGARRPTSQYLACCEAFVYGKFVLYPTKDAYNLNGAVITDYFSELRKDLELISLGMYFCELAAYYTVENQEEAATVDLLCTTLKVLSENRMDKRLIRAIYELRIAAINGEAPVPYECVRCHNSKVDELAGISFLAGGAVCMEHEKEFKDVIHMVPAAIYSVYYVITSPLNKLFSFRLDEQALSDFVYYMSRYMKAFVKKEFKSLDFLSNFVSL